MTLNHSFLNSGSGFGAAQHNGNGYGGTNYGYGNNPYGNGYNTNTGYGNTGTYGRNNGYDTGYNNNNGYGYANNYGKVSSNINKRKVEQNMERIARVATKSYKMVHMWLNY